LSGLSSRPRQRSLGAPAYAPSPLTLLVEQARSAPQPAQKGAAQPPTAIRAGLPWAGSAQKLPLALRAGRLAREAVLLLVLRPALLASLPLV
jgi:hypothetical protein